MALRNGNQALGCHYALFPHLTLRDPPAGHQDCFPQRRAGGGGVHSAAPWLRGGQRRHLLPPEQGTLRPEAGAPGLAQEAQVRAGRDGLHRVKRRPRSLHQARRRPHLPTHLCRRHTGRFDRRRRAAVHQGPDPGCLRRPRPGPCHLLLGHGDHPRPRQPDHQAGTEAHDG